MQLCQALTHQARRCTEESPFCSEKLGNRIESPERSASPLQSRQSPFIKLAFLPQCPLYSDFFPAAAKIRTWWPNEILCKLLDKIEYTKELNHDAAGSCKVCGSSSSLRSTLPYTSAYRNAFRRPGFSWIAQSAVRIPPLPKTPEEEMVGTKMDADNRSPMYIYACAATNY